MIPSIDIGRIIGGPDEGDGPAGIAMNLMTALVPAGAVGLTGMGSFDAVGGAGGVASAVHTGSGVDGLGGAAASAFEFDNVLSRMFHGSFTEPHVGDLKALWDLLHGTSSARIAIGKEAEKVALAHGGLRQILQKHSSKSPTVAGLLETYDKLGTALPDEPLLRDIKRALGHYIHHDLGPEEAKASKALNGFIRDLETGAMREQYEIFRNLDPKGIRDILEKLKTTPVDIGAFSEAITAAEKATKETVKPIAGFLAGPAESIKPSSAPLAEEAGLFKNMSKTKIGLAVASVAAIGVGAYFMLRSFGKRAHHHPASHGMLGIGGDKVEHTERLKHRDQQQELTSQHAV